MSREVNAISGRLSLREPQRTSLQILDRICTIAPPDKEPDLEAVLRVIHDEYPAVTDFERDFPSLCFALATGVGKTRLMGAFVAYLSRTGRSRNFFVLAPNLTIYNKLIADFTPGTPKYVFQGLAEFATSPPVVITGDNYESGIGVRQDARRSKQLFPQFGDDTVHINVFNISKINTDVRASQRGNHPPRIKRLAEYIGESYFDYLAGLPDLVLMMDEAHRYRAAAGMKAINELKPILGLELTATPFVESARGPVWFKNTVYSYNLAAAIEDGFVKEPAVATRKDFSADALDEAQLERIKLEDGVRIHEQVKTDLEVYAREHGRQLVKPFLLVVSRDVEHAKTLLELIQSEGFFGGRYADKVIEVHSALRGEEKEDTVQRLLDVERPDEPTEIVIHVNMLKEGWDVTNLYTIVPLRAANARTLIEQSIGRGLRLPFGRRTGVKAVDRLTIVAHDKFQEIVDEANNPDSVIRKIETIVLDEDDLAEAPKAEEVAPLVTQVLSGETQAADLPLLAQPQPGAGGTPAPPRIPLNTPETQAIAKATLEVISQERHLSSAKALEQPEVQKKIVEKVKVTVPQEYTTTPTLPGVGVPLELVVREATAAYVTLSIDIPTITMVPTGEVAFGYNDFDLDTSRIHYQTVSEEILIQHLQSNKQDLLASNIGGIEEARLEDYLVSALLSFDDVDYDSNAALLYKLGGQLVAHLRSYLDNDDEVKNVLIRYQDPLGRLVHSQMEAHRWEHVTGWEVKVTSGHRPLTPTVVKLRPGEQPLPFRAPVADKRRITQMVFGGFNKCLYPMQKFDSDPERRFAVVLESDRQVLKWVKPAARNFQIQFRGGDLYEPDFVVESSDYLYLVEVKRRDLVEDKQVLEKAEAAKVWCKNATDYTGRHGGKPWRYVLIPDDGIQDNYTMGWLVQQYGK